MSRTAVIKLVLLVVVLTLLAMAVGDLPWGPG